MSSFKIPNLQDVHIPNYSNRYQQGEEANSNGLIAPMLPESREYDSQATARAEYQSKRMNEAGGMRVGGRGRKTGWTYGGGHYRGMTQGQAYEKAGEEFDNSQGNGRYAPTSKYAANGHFMGLASKEFAPKGQSPSAQGMQPPSGQDWAMVAQANRDAKQGVVERGDRGVRYANGASITESGGGNKVLSSPYGTGSYMEREPEAPKQAPRAHEAPQFVELPSKDPNLDGITRPTADAMAPQAAPQVTAPNVTPRIHVPTLPASDVLTRQPRKVMPTSRMKQEAPTPVAAQDPTVATAPEAPTPVFDTPNISQPKVRFDRPMRVLPRNLEAEERRGKWMQDRVEDVKKYNTPLQALKVFKGGVLNPMRKWAKNNPNHWYLQKPTAISNFIKGQ